MEHIIKYILENGDLKVLILGLAWIGWNGMRQICIYRGLLAKFRQNPDLLEKLLATENALLAECAVRDQIWGIGLSMSSKNRFDTEKWRGKNLLGFALMQVRDTLRKTE